MAWEEDNPWYGGFYLVHGQFIQQGREFIRSDYEVSDATEQKPGINVVPIALSLTGLAASLMRVRRQNRRV
jgi:hypothetical protein